MRGFQEYSLAALAAISLLLTPVSSAGAQTPSSVMKDMFGNDCVTELLVKDALSPAYAVIVYMNTCNRIFSIEWTVSGRLAGSTGIAAFGRSEVTVLRSAMETMEWRFY